MIWLRFIKTIIWSIRDKKKNLNSKPFNSTSSLYQTKLFPRSIDLKQEIIFYVGVKNPVLTDAEIYKPESALSKKYKF